ncbi:MAG: LytTR family transcriptional regulator, partial [Lachnospiraceae bacterium]|nr:LytTR family transcriptional regulator [Lachnospiraceae bacterium]
ILLHINDKEYYLTLDKILFFETENKEIRSHTSHEISDTQYKLYELEEILPGYFMRISKTTIVNLNHIYAITRNITSSSVVEFNDCHKLVYVSRNYYKALVERLGEKRRKI